MTSSRSEDWQRVRDVEDMLALVTDIDQERILIKRWAWQIAHGPIFEASKRQRLALERLKAQLSARWRELTAEAK